MGHRRALGAQKPTEELAWRLGNWEECGPGREKSETNPSSACCSHEDQQNRLDWFKANRSLFFFLIPASETVKPGAVKRPELDPKRGHPNN